MKKNFTISIIIFFLVNILNLISPSPVLAALPCPSFCRNVAPEVKCNYSQCQVVACGCVGTHDCSDLCMSIPQATRCNTSACNIPECGCSGAPVPPGPIIGTDINCEQKIHNPALSSLLCRFNGPEFLQTALSTFISLGIIIASVAFFFMIMLGGIKWITSGGDKNHLETAQKQISSGITGLAILFSIFAIIKVVEMIFGISILTFTLPRLGN